MLCFTSDTSDVHSVNATVVGEYSIHIQCLFSHGSDAVGYKIVILGDCQGTDYQQPINLIRQVHYRLASGQLNVSERSSCYHRVFAYGIDVNYTTSALRVEGRIQPLTINYILVIIHNYRIIMN